MLPHEKLEVYRKALDFIGDASAALALWDKRHAVEDQFAGASDSLVLNLAEGARLRPGRAKLRALDCALGSCLGCAACLNIAWIKGFLETRETADHKRRVCEIARMLAGLGKAWSAWRLHEDSPPYNVRSSEDHGQLFGSGSSPFSGLGRGCGGEGGSRVGLGDAKGFLGQDCL